MGGEADCLRETDMTFTCIARVSQGVEWDHKKTVRRKARKVGIDVEWALVFKSASRKAGILWKG